MLGSLWEDMIHVSRSLLGGLCSKVPEHLKHRRVVNYPHPAATSAADRLGVIISIGLISGTFNRYVPSSSWSDIKSRTQPWHI